MLDEAHSSPTSNIDISTMTREDWWCVKLSFKPLHFDGMACGEFIIQFSRPPLVSYLNTCIPGVPLSLDTGLVLTTQGHKDNKRELSLATVQPDMLRLVALSDMRAVLLILLD